jgi:NADH-quinone oxidoreductase subunit J
MTSMTANLLYLVFALGGAGMYLLLPKENKRQSLAGAVIGGLAVVALLVVLAARVASPDQTSAFFYLFAAIAVLSASRVVTHPNPVYCAVYFVLVVVAVAALLVLQRAEFLAVALVLIYAGAILVTYLFVIMLAQQGGSAIYDRRSREPLLAVLAGFVLMAAVAGRAGNLPAPAPASPAAVATADTDDPAAAPFAGNTAAVGAAVMTKYVVALEIAGVLLLVAMVGAIALSRKKVPVAEAVFTTAPKPIGQIGREVEPY